MVTQAIPLEARNRLSLKEKISYGLGDFGNGFMFDLGQAYLLKFYTDVAGLPGSVAAGVFVFTRSLTRSWIRLRAPSSITAERLGGTADSVR